MTVTLTNIELHVYGTVTHKIESVWNDEKNDFEKTEVPYEAPMVHILFSAETREMLVPNGIYFDGINMFLATAPHKIINIKNHVSRFSIPTELALVTNPYSG